MAVPQYVSVKNYEANIFGVALEKGSKIVNREAILFRRSECDLRFGLKNKDKKSLFLYFDVTSKKVVSTDENGKNALAPGNMVNIAAYDIKKSPVGDNVAMTKCEEIQLRKGAAENNFVLSAAKQKMARTPGSAAAPKAYYDLFHDGVYVGTTDQDGYNVAIDAVV